MLYVSTDAFAQPNTSLHLITPDWPAPSQVRAIVTTRKGGYSVSPYDSFNLGEYTDDDVKAVRLNRRKLEAHIGIPNIRWIKQVHGVDVIDVYKSDSSNTLEADGCYTESVNQVCAIVTADCLPILICNREGSRVAALHAGWRGLANGIIETGLNRSGIPPEDALVWFGPSIGVEAYQVGEDLRQVFMSTGRYTDEAIYSNFVSSGDNKYMCNLIGLARAELATLGVKDVYGGNHCTYSEPGSFYSYRRDGDTGRFASLVWIDSSLVQ